jgi:hypothetical protein
MHAIKNRPCHANIRHFSLNNKRFQLFLDYSPARLAATPHKRRRKSLAHKALRKAVF